MNFSYCIIKMQERNNVRFDDLKNQLWKNDEQPENANAIIYNEVSKIRRIINKYTKKSFPLRASDSEPEGEAWVAKTNTITLPRRGCI